MSVEPDLYGHCDRPSLPVDALRNCSAAVCIVAFSSLAWIQKTFNMTEKEALTFKANAQHDFDCLMLAARQTKARRV